MQITSIHARQILDSRGDPTIEVDLEVDGKYTGRAAVPSGASTGTHEALELRDNEPEHYLGKGVLQAVDHVNNTIFPALQSRDFNTTIDLDRVLLELDGTPTKSKLGANAILGVSMAFTQAAAAAEGLPLYAYINKLFNNLSGLVVQPLLPRPGYNIMNGGAHANWSTDIQEFMIFPLHTATFAESLETASEITHHLGKLLEEKGLSTNVGNEGGYAPDLESNQQALDLIMEAIRRAGFKPGEQVSIGLDVAAGEFCVSNQLGDGDDIYRLRAEGKEYSTLDWMAMLQGWLTTYPITSIEDPLGEDAWTAWAKFTSENQALVGQIVGDDFLVTSLERLQKAIGLQAGNAILIKLNQVGSVMETLQTMALAYKSGWKCMISHRSGETEDTFIAHLAVGTGCGQIKSGAPTRGERTAKYNELLRIEEELSQTSTGSA